MDILQAIRERRSIRAFLDVPVGRKTLEAVLDAARWAPSGVNAQPWEVVVVTGESKKRLTEELLKARRAGERERPDYAIYPSSWKEPYLSRRKACGLALYKALGIGKEDSDRKLKSWELNYAFFGAPAGLLFFLDRDLVQSSWVDIGMFIQNVMLAALAHGLGTCPQAALAEYPDIARRVLGVPETKALVCGLSIGVPDLSAPVNGYRTAREGTPVFTTWRE
ncbi:MAG: nitroreductase [Elusimicrobiota bacterium]